MYFKMANHVHMSYIRPLFVEFMFFIIGNFQDGMQAGGSLPLPIIHILAQLKAFKIKVQPKYIRAKSINIVKMWLEKNRCGG